MKSSLRDICGQLEIWQEWQENYSHYVPKFIKYAAEGLHWSDWDQKIFYEFFHRSNDQCVSSLRQGYFTKEEQEQIKQHWNELSPLLQELAQHQEVLNLEVCSAIKKWIRKHTYLDKRAATNRLIASLQPQLLTTVVNDNKLYELHKLLLKYVDNYNVEWLPTWFENSHKILNFFKNELGQTDTYGIVTLPWQVFEEFDPYFQSNNRDMSEPINNLDTTINLLKYKKQIILQGPPGTGKTKLAKEIAKLLTNNKLVDINFLKETLKVGVNFKSSKHYSTYTVVSVNGNNITFSNSGNKNFNRSFDKLLSVWEQQRGLGKTATSGDLSFDGGFNLYINQLLERSFINEKIRTVQFHPSYTYEDFVRGLVAKPNPDGEGVIYEAEDKVLAKIAKEAYENYIASQLNSSDISAETSIFDAFIDYIKDEIASSELHKFDITEAVYLFAADETRFKYKGDNWKAHSKGLNMKFSELKKIIDSGAKERQDIKKLIELEELTRQHASYFIKIVEKYYQFKETFSPKTKQVSTELKNYVLIIDEINRANFSSVIGELIYALEYRGKEVDSMYAINSDHKIILPPNLYIIGTMNTADRSVGHIDYAIRRRFAFVDVLPEDLTSEMGEQFYTDMFNDVALLFNDHLNASEFKKEEVQLGHSYFIDKSEDGGSKSMRWSYEIKPILLEYVKDGILKEAALQFIDKLSNKYAQD